MLQRKIVRTNSQLSKQELMLHCCLEPVPMTGVQHPVCTCRVKEYIVVELIESYLQKIKVYVVALVVTRPQVPLG